MIETEEQSEALLESSITASSRKSSFFWERLRRFGREFLAFVLIQLIKIYDLFGDGARDTQQSRREFPAAEAEIVYADFSADLINEIEAEDDDIDQDGQSPVDVQMPDTRLESVGPMDGSELGPARVDEGYVIPTSTGGPMLILSATIETAASPAISISLPSRPPPTTQNSKEIAVSYHYKDANKRVKAISELISATTRDNPIPVFYAPKYQARIAGLNGTKKLQRIYRQAALVVVFLSPKYHISRFCYSEWRAIKDRFFGGCKDQQRERLLLVKLGDFEGEELELVADDFPIDGTKMSNKELADIIVDRWQIVEQPSTPTTNT